MYRCLSLIRISALGISLLTVASARANTINVLNGGFESTSVASSSEFGTDYAGQIVDNWYATGYSFFFTPGTADTTGAASQYGQGLQLWGSNNGGLNTLTSSPLGGNFLALDGGFPGHTPTVSQTLSGLTVGSQTTVDFYYAGSQQYGFTGNTTEGWQVSLSDGTNTETHSTAILNNASHGFTGWQSASLSFTPTSTTETLQFLALGTPDGVPPFTLLDGVSVTDNVNSTVTPEPSSLALLGTGVLSLGGMIRRRYMKA